MNINNSADPSRVPMTMTREELAAELQVTTKTIDNQWRAGKLPAPCRVGKSIRFVRKEVMAYLENSRLIPQLA